MGHLLRFVVGSAQQARRELHAAVRIKIKEFINNEEVDLAKTWRNQMGSLHENVTVWLQKMPQRYGVSEAEVSLAVQTAYKSQ
eukprot:666491-Prorocentrum_minimum.AAC.1